MNVEFISLDEELEREFQDLFSNYNDPLSELIAAEDEQDDEPVVIPPAPTTTNQLETSMKTTSNFNLDNFLSTLDAVVGDNAKAPSSVTWKPDFLETKGDLTPANSFAITAGVVKAARRITDGLKVAKERLAAVNERIQVQEARAEAQTVGRTQDHIRAVHGADGVSFAPAVTINEAKGFNPDGIEYQEALQELYAQAEKNEAIIEKGAGMMDELFRWIHEFAGILELKVEVGSETVVDLLGNEFRRPKMVPLDQNSLILGIAAQKAFIQSVKR